MRGMVITWQAVTEYNNNTDSNYRYLPTLGDGKDVHLQAQSIQAMDTPLPHLGDLQESTVYAKNYCTQKCLFSTIIFLYTSFLK